MLKSTFSVPQEDICYCAQRRNRTWTCKVNFRASCACKRSNTRKHTVCVKTQHLVIIHVNLHGSCNKWTYTVENENTCVTVNWIRAALKMTVGYIPAAIVCLILIKRQKTNSKSLSPLDRRTFVALTGNKGSLILTVKTMLFYFTFNY